LGTAFVAEELAKYTGCARPTMAYTAGLLHDIGKVVLDQYIASAHPFFYRRTQMDMHDLCNTENEIIGISHPEAGGLLAENWALPDNLTDTIRHHHFPERANVDRELTHLVYLADLMMSRFKVGQELECLNLEKLDKRMESVGLKRDQFPVLVDLIPHKILGFPLNGAAKAYIG
jgi:putative nucleotidyltransferase with HDIG domain